MIKLIDLLTEEQYNYGCVMLYFNIPQIFKVQDDINPKDLYEEDGESGFGFENKPHITLLYGLHPEVISNDVKEVLKKYEFGKCKIFNASLFEDPKYDVLKFDVEGDALYKANSDLSTLPHTTNFPDYHPHMTIAYLQPGTGKRYVKSFKNIEYEIIPSYAIYSKPAGTKEKIKIKLGN